MQHLTQTQLQQIAGGCTSWYHFISCNDRGATQAEFEMHYGTQPEPDDVTMAEIYASV